MIACAWEKKGLFSTLFSGISTGAKRLVYTPLVAHLWKGNIPWKAHTSTILTLTHPVCFLWMCATLGTRSSSPSVVMGVKLSAVKPTNMNKTPRGTELSGCSHFRYTWRVKKRKKKGPKKKKSNVSAIFSYDQSHLPRNACKDIFHPFFCWAFFFFFLQLHHKSP